MSADRHVPSSGLPDPVSGRLLDNRYLVGARIARGGMASVYEATDTRLDRTVAIKVMHAGLGDDDEFAARFVREARAAARLSHPHVVSVFDQGNDDGIVFLAMELVQGHTLRDTIAKESPMPPARALALLEPVLSALASAHRAGLVHRDVKPENVLIADDGRVKVADFGLAKAVSADTQHTATKGVLIGTVSYLAPELVVEGRADARADVYAAGVVLYELLTGSKPHEGESPIQVAYKHVHHDVPPPSALVPDLPPYVDALVARATARDPGQRPADASVLLHQVHRVAHALADGAPDDAELTADLALLAPAREGDTSPDMWDDAEMAALMEPAAAVREDTATYPAAKPPPMRPPASAPPAAPTREPRPPRPRPQRPRRSRRGPLLLVLALLLTTAGGGAAYWLGWARYTSTPGVIGLAQAAAEDKLDSAGLTVEYADEAYSETVPAGMVIATDPTAGSRILQDGTVTVTVSLGKERYDVPQLKGLTEDQAQDALIEVKLAYDETIERWSETVPAGTVLRSVPAMGTTLRPGAAVDLVVSKGRRPIKVGSWVGKDIDDVRRALERRGLEAEVTSEVYDDAVPDGHVISQTPRTGTLFRGEAVSFVVSKGPKLVEVPNVTASGYESAVEKLEALGFEVKVVRGSTYIGLGFVYSMDPGAGAMIPEGSTVTLNLV
ncbi:Stk1 family PASTA domain-containing Ser/Thr kinase [Nocardioides sp. cx-173]|uniref:Stk1 family PASTA domain-containing Ser/Thr kinase n=1 Tax=Nocardioides sp. cx-173 TaxID=2898796 RepID=UPI001E2A0DC9|nr:Stk1 family PASTA domain-containing Ser/Thr kinase [Nocardioides sp. cx-173]MCD4526301.1 Stk1 family PASTA domain-containing Ser/Thr kinase [Nocardioides sp. cx-173]UGB43477.1 Stk1 family PASTA domain-containing Ser/Thr kinase [Nocardioides sp. cx-173]